MYFMTWSQERHKKAKNMHLPKSVHISSASNCYLKKENNDSIHIQLGLWIFVNNINVRLNVRGAECFEGC